MSMKMNFKDIPDNPSNQFDLPAEGVYELVITGLEKELSANNSIMLTFTLDVKGTTSKLWQRAVLFDAEGNSILIGQAILKKIMKACNVMPEGDFTIEILPPLLMGKTFKAYLNHKEYNGKKSLEIKQLESIVAVDITVGNVPEVSTDTKTVNKEIAEELQKTEFVEDDTEI